MHPDISRRQPVTNINNHNSPPKQDGESNTDEVLYETMDFIWNLRRTEGHYDYPKRRPASVDVNEMNKKRANVSSTLHPPVLHAANGGSHTLPKPTKNTYKVPHRSKAGDFPSSDKNRNAELFPVLPPRSSTFPREKQPIDKCKTTWYVPEDELLYEEICPTKVTTKISKDKSDETFNVNDHDQVFVSECDQGDSSSEDELLYESINEKEEMYVTITQDKNREYNPVLVEKKLTKVADRKPTGVRRGTRNSEPTLSVSDIALCSYCDPNANYEEDLRSDLPDLVCLRCKNGGSKDLQNIHRASRRRSTSIIRNTRTYDENLAKLRTIAENSSVHKSKGLVIDEEILFTKERLPSNSDRSPDGSPEDEELQDVFFGPLPI